MQAPMETLNLRELVDLHFAGLERAEGEPKATILMGPICSGKTSVRKERYTREYVVLDAADIWLQFTGSTAPCFPGPWAPMVSAIGAEVFRRAVEGRYNLVFEIIGNDYSILEALIQRFPLLGYKVDVVYVGASLELCVQRKAARNDDNLSAYFTEGYHAAWVLGIDPLQAAAREEARRSGLN